MAFSTSSLIVYIGLAARAQGILSIQKKKKKREREKERERERNSEKTKDNIIISNASSQDDYP